MPIRWMTLFLDLPAADFDPAVTFWATVTDSTLSAARGPAGEFATLLPATGDAYIRVQRIRDGAGGRHLDLHIDPAAEPLEAVAARAVGLGATVRHREPAELIVLDSPGGFTFCLVPWDGESSVPAPTIDDRGARHRLDQLCLDLPADGFDRECSFWANLTGWPLHRSSLPEFASLGRPPALPVRLMFQRLDQADPDEVVRGHLDFAADDREALAERHLALGARWVGRFSHWITVADPAGQPYCLTVRDPVTGTTAL
jgi:hypothetical protein